MKYPKILRIRNNPMKQLAEVISTAPDLEVVREWPGIRDDILRIERDCYEESLRYSEEEFLEDLNDNDARFLVLRSGGRIEGFISAAPLHRLDYCSFDAHIGMEDTLYIIGIAVAPAFRKRGYAACMLSYLITGNDFSRYSAHAVGNASKQLFVGSGFRDEGAFPGWMGGHDAAYMVRER